MRWFCLTVFFGSVLWAQQQVIPPELNNKQKEIYERLTKSVSAPCCSNSIPVAYHESGMALYIRDYIRDSLMEGDSEKTLVAKLKDLKLGQENRAVVFAVPEKNWLGRLVWLTPAAAVLFGSLLIFLLFMVKKSGKVASVKDDDLIDNYRDYIRARAKGTG